MRYQLRYVRLSLRHVPGDGGNTSKSPSGRTAGSGCHPSGLLTSGGIWAEEDTLSPFFDAARQWRPVREIHVGSFLIARHPLTVAQVRHWLPDYADDYAETDATAARIEDDLDELLEALPFRLPSETKGPARRIRRTSDGPCP